MSSNYVIHYDGDGGGLGAFLLSYIGASLISDALGYHLITVNPLICALLSIDNPVPVCKALSAKNIFRINDAAAHSQNKVVSLQALREIVSGNSSNCLLYGRHHMPPIVIYEFLTAVGSYSFATYASLVLSKLNLSTFFGQIDSKLKSHDLAVHIRTFFDSASGRMDFYASRSLLYGFLVDEISKYSRGTECYLACDSEHEWKVAKEVLDHNGIVVPNLRITALHSSLSHYYGRAILYPERSISQDIELLMSQSEFKMMHNLRLRLVPTITDWLSLGKCSLTICTNTSFAITSCLLQGNKFISFPCRSDLLNLSLPMSFV